MIILSISIELKPGLVKRQFLMQVIQEFLELPLYEFTRQLSNIVSASFADRSMTFTKLMQRNT